MKYNRPQATASWGMMAKDWEKGIDYDRLTKERLKRAQAAIRHAGLGGVVAFNFDNIRYITGTHIGEWARDKFFRYALCPVEGPPYLWDPAPPAKRISSPWIADNVGAPLTTMQGALPPHLGVAGDFAKQIKKALVHYGIDKEPIGIDTMELPMLRALEKEGIEVVDGQQAMLDAREVKTADEIELLKVACAMVDATYVDIVKAIRPGTRENELVAIAHDRLFRMGSERVECINSVSGQRGRPHSHTFSDRMIQPGDMIFLDIMHSFNGYRTCYYRTFICGEPNRSCCSTATASACRCGNGRSSPSASPARTRASRKAWCSRSRPGRAPRTAPAPPASRKRWWSPRTAARSSPISRPIT
jgi:Xaa-Pro aminopeptidase